MIDQLKPGQTIRCTVIKQGRTPDDESTLARLMRQDPAMRRTLKNAQIFRDRHVTVIRSRGGRPWAVRRPVAKYAIPSLGATWTMKWTPLLVGEFKAVSQYLKIERA